ncbi:MAG TPA: M20 family metallopeptidase [Burkholderiaceae bacterium]|nr:M20 family metallopeptidase [Burkholderiaceae bacterium]
MNVSDLRPLIDSQWHESLLPRLVDYIRIPAKSPAFDPDWQANGHLDAAIALAHDWCRAQPIDGLALEIVRLPGRTPCLFFDVPATGGLGNERSVLFYGHLDKQPEMVGWRDGFGPWIPVIDSGKLYGRGGADDGYAVFAALTAIRALDSQRVPRPRCVGLIETCEESGSFDLPAYLDALAPRLGDVTLVVGLDSGCGNYDQLWVTTSLRGLVNGVLTVEVLTEGVHSGAASGVVPSSFRIARQLLDRLDDPATGMLRVPALNAPIPDERIEQARAAGKILGESVWRQFPWVPNDASHAMPTTTDPVEAILNRTWRAALSVTGADHLPPSASAGNVLRPKTSLKLSLRLPPPVDGERALQAVRETLEADPPYGARVRFEAEQAATGWNAPPTAPWLRDALERASQRAYGRPAAWIGEGGTIPFMAMLGSKFPDAQFVITGVLGPQSNAHGPNEFLHIDYAKRLTAAVASIVADVAAAAGPIRR